jgi:hypothetical protein
MMNRQIRLLADKAKIDYELLPEIAREPVWIALDDELEKFAELIVQECVDIISPYTVRMNRPGEEFLHPLSEIKKHFGMKE